MQLSEQAQSNQAILRDCIAIRIVQTDGLNQPKAYKPKRKRTTVQPEDGENGLSLDEDLNEFVDYIVQELFHSLPNDVQELSYSAIKGDSSVADKFGLPLSTKTFESFQLAIPSVVEESLETYAFVASSDDNSAFWAPVWEEYVGLVTRPPPPNDPSIKASACEICSRDWIPLTYHHLIPRQTHTKAVRRGWHPEWRLNSVAWLCRACHSFVHSSATNEELAREYWSIENLLERSEVQAFAKWIGRARWKPR